MGIKLSVYPWCENCSDFSPEVQVQHIEALCGNLVLCDTTITCKNEHRCTGIKKYLESEMKGEKKDGASKEMR